MKTAIFFILLSLGTLLTASPAYSQSLTSIDQVSNLESDLEELNELIEKHFQTALTLSEKLAKFGLTLSSASKAKMPAPLAQEVETYQNTRLSILDAIAQYRLNIDRLPTQTEISTVENSKFLFNLALIRALLPRLDLPQQEGLINKLLGYKELRYVDALITREYALEQLYTDFKEASPERALKAITLYNRLADTFNSNKGSKILPTYSKDIKVSSVVMEGSLYTAIARGEELNKHSAVLCAKLFN